MKILITGSNGFIGVRLSEKLRSKGHEVFGFNRASNNDILSFEQVKKAVNGMDAVFHLAASLKEDDPLLFETNVSGTKNILEAGAKAQIKHFFYLSTVGVMGNISGIADENTPFNPQTPYEKSKANAEELVLTFQEVLPITIVRSALVLGPNNQWEQIIKLIKKDFPLIGSGENLWQIVFVQDLVDALVFLVDKEDIIGETFIVAEQNPKTLMELIKLIRKELGKNTEVKTIPAFLGLLLSYFFLIKGKITGKKSFLEPRYVQRLVRLRHYSIEKIKHLGWQPKYSTEQAVKETVKNIKSN